MIRNIQALRAVAALMVIVHHIVASAEGYGPRSHYLRFFWGWGASGVDIFFVISGFIMVCTQSNKPRSARAFFANRLARILPLYWLLTLAIVCIGIVMPSAVRNLDVSGLRIVQSLLFITGLWDTHPLVTVAWSLELEMLFYAVFAIGIALGNRYAAIGLCITILSGLALIGLTLPLEFLFGMGIAILFLRYPKLQIGWPCLLIGSALLLASIPLGEVKIHRVSIWGIPAFLIVLGAVYLPQMQSRLALYLGAASYSIYLAQVFSIPAYYKVASRHLASVDGDVIVVAAIVLTAASGCLVYEALEKPLSRAMKSLKTRGMTSKPAG